MLRFPISDLLDDQRCHDLLLRVLHPRGLRCPRGHPLPPEQAPHDRHRAPIFAYRCRECGAVYTLFTGSIWRGSRLPCSKIVLILRGIAHSVPTVHLAEELGLDRSHLLRRRHQIQSLVEERLFLSILSDLVTEADEMYQNAGEKGIPHRDPNDPPRRRANSRRGRGSWDNDRPAVVGVAGREHQTLHLRVCRRTNRETLEPFVESHTVPGCHLYTDQWRAYGRLGRTARVARRPPRSSCQT